MTTHVGPGMFPDPRSEDGVDPDTGFPLHPAPCSTAETTRDVGDVSSVRPVSSMSSGVAPVVTGAEGVSGSGERNEASVAALPHTSVVWAVRGLYWIASALTVAIALGAVLVMSGVAAGWWQASAVLTGSMDPNLPPKSLMLAQPHPTKDLEVGQVLMFTAPTENQEQVVHRIIAVDRDPTMGIVAVETKGDANPIADPWTAQIVNDTSWVVRAHVPYAGIAVTNPWVAGSVFLALLLMVYGSGVVLGEWAQHTGRGSDASVRRPSPAAA